MSIKKKVLNSEWIVILLLLAFFPPAYLNQNAMLDHVLDALKLFGFLLIFCFYLTDIRKHIQKPFNILLIALLAELFIATLISEEASLYAYLTQAITVFSVCFLTEEIAIHNPYVGLKSMYIYFSVCVLINTLTVFVYPNAMYANNRGIRVCWFLGEDNGGYIYYIIASMTALLYCHYVKKRVTVISLLVWCCAFIFVFYRDIATGIVCQIVWLSLVIFSRFDWFKKTLLARYAFYITAGGFALLVVMRRLILEPITTALHRSVTLTGRTFIWDKVLILISRRIFFGYGVCDGTVFDSLAMNKGLLNAHNWLLMLMYYGGGFAALIFLILFYVTCKERKAEIGTGYNLYLTITLIVLSARFLVEAGSMQFFPFLLALMAYRTEFVKKLECGRVEDHISLLSRVSFPRIRVIVRGVKS